MKKIPVSKENLIILGYMFAIPGLKLIYFFLNRIPRPAVNVLIWVDSYIPLLPVFVVPYIIFYPFVLCCLIFLFLRNRKTYIHVVKAYSVGLIVCYLTYLLFQTTVPRPELVHGDIFSKILGFIYHIDEPYNALPSIHVLGTMLTMLGLKEAKIDSIYMKSIGWLIIVSTMFVKQHGILDVVTGLGLSYGVYSLTTTQASSEHQLSQ